MIRSYRDLMVWQRGVELAEEVYQLDRQLPPTERFVVGAQLRRCALSIPANIAEGHGRSRGELLRYLRIARGSLAELETHLIVAERSGLVERGATARAASLSDEVSRMLAGLMQAIRVRPAARVHPNAAP